MLVLVFAILFFLMLALALPIFFSMVLSSALPLLPNLISFEQFAEWSVVKTMNATGVPIVLFIIAGQVMSSGKLTEKIYDVFNISLELKPDLCLLYVS